MRWLVMGGTSGIGRQLVEQLDRKSIAVRAFGRSAGETQFDGSHIQGFKGDARDASDVNAALEDADIVVQALGIRERPAMLWERETLFSDATSVLIPAMQAASVKRLITITGYGSGESKQTMSKLVALGHNAVLGRVYADKSRQEDMIKVSDLDWTLVRPTILNAGALSKRYKVLTEPSSWRLGTISRADVAHFVMEAGENGSFIRQSVVLA
ncbi:MAG: NAD(P)H-binding protein [Pseudomonadota bacterium]